MLLISKGPFPSQYGMSNEKIPAKICKFWIDQWRPIYLCSPNELASWDGTSLWVSKNTHYGLIKQFTDLHSGFPSTTVHSPFSHDVKSSQGSISEKKYQNRQLSILALLTSYYLILDTLFSGVTRVLVRFVCKNVRKTREERKWLTFLPNI